jgi:hypothetical protein
MKKSDFVLKALIISLRRHGMERQYMMILLLTWTLLLSPKVRLFAERTDSYSGYGSLQVGEDGPEFPRLTVSWGRYVGTTRRRLLGFGQDAFC